MARRRRRHRSLLLARAVHRVGAGWDRVVAWVNALELEENTILLAFALVIGVMGGLGVVGFYRLLDLA
jgi:hypothetical protein